MTQIAHKVGDVEIGDTVTLKVGSLEGVIVGFGLPEPSTVPPGLLNVSYVEAIPSAHVMWATKDGGFTTSSVPLAALSIKTKAKESPSPI